ncbi:MAG: hypothetical protein AVDCRST_MAG25-1274 [uncultured Rubrobacteraceae bacterium]|uniref:Uncharacterized protein n=1 Tax=uncultured Rubrobacteraceae bacterium TaxID=349277 RepID=A0A6J4R9I2_9ACTN|nr:MAG: hypothetical protein AVDCRST_MAG25-1274 [uncultured Rubrobacteraceae bacterium]
MAERRRSRRGPFHPAQLFIMTIVCNNDIHRVVYAAGSSQAPVVFCVSWITTAARDTEQDVVMTRNREGYGASRVW